MAGVRSRSLCFIALAFAGLIAACASSPSRPIGDAPLGTAPVRVAFWVGDGGDPHGEVDGHPCGGVSIRAVTSIPPEDDPHVEADVAVEYGWRGREMRRWRLPVDYQIFAVAGDRLLIEEHGQRFWVDSAGAIGAAEDLSIEEEPVETDCPSIDALDGDYVRCALFRDHGTGKTRRIAYEGVCT